MTLSALGSAIASPLLRATNLARRYGEVEALSSCALSVDAGEIVAIVGANGCGKSTLLRALADIVPNVVHGIVDGVGATGTVEVDGRVLARGDAARVRAFVPQRPVVAADFTAREVVRLGRFARGADEAAVDRALSAVGLEARGA
ncbi:MAG: ATP-binding cassette domain-containing protein, partial [bacterium]